MFEEGVSHELIGKILIGRKKITSEQLQEALKIQKIERGFIGEILVKLGYLDDLDIVVALVMQCGLPYISVNKYDIDPAVIRLIPVDVARQHHVIPLDRIGEVLSVVVSNPLSDELKDKLEVLTGCRVAVFISTKREIEEAIGRSYPPL